MKTIEEVNTMAQAEVGNYVVALKSRPSTLARATAYAVLFTSESYIVRDMLAKALHELAIQMTVNPASNEGTSNATSV